MVLPPLNKTFEPSALNRGYFTDRATPCKKYNGSYSILRRCRAANGLRGGFANVYTGPFFYNFPSDFGHLTIGGVLALAKGPNASPRLFLLIYREKTDAHFLGQWH
jgi:hypothetical protein